MTAAFQIDPPSDRHATEKVSPLAMFHQETALHGESPQLLSDKDIYVPAAKTFLGIAYTSISGKPTTSMINRYMLNNEKSFEDLIMRL